MILDYSDDETESVEWIEDNATIILPCVDIFDCGCCDDCLCDYQIECINCKCSCSSNIENYDSEFDLNDEKKEIDYNIIDFTIDVVEDKNKDRKVKISLNLNLENKRNLNINLDIKSALYLQIADELIKK
jgi:hypothetical protein